MIRLLFSIMVASLSTILCSQDAKLTPLFNGKDLSGWEQYGGTATYAAEDGVLVGTAVVKTPNSFLCTERPYGDFILTFEFEDNPNLNSGVMFRAQWRQDKELRRIYGYQMEIDPSPRAYTGGIYDEARRGWLYPLHYNPPARAAYRQAGWNTARIEAIGNELRTFINGVPAANMIDDFDDSGLICLQVHSIPAKLAKELRPQIACQLRSTLCRPTTSLTP